MAGNVTLVLIWFFLGSRRTGREYIGYIAALVCAAAAKFLVLYIGIVKIAVPVLSGLPEKQAAVISSMFSIPQLFTALAGGAFAAAILPALRRALYSGQK